VEGEVDALKLGQELRGMAAVVTFGGTSGRPVLSILGKMITAYPRFIALDADTAGDNAAANWPDGGARRIRPPCPFKDWSDAAAGGIDLLRWWRDIMAAVERP
jgi:hypothetical protein